MVLSNVISVLIVKTVTMISLLELWELCILWELYALWRGGANCENCIHCEGVGLIVRIVCWGIPFFFYKTTQTRVKDGTPASAEGKYGANTALWLRDSTNCWNCCSVAKQTAQRAAFKWRFETSVESRSFSVDTERSANSVSMSLTLG